MQCTVGVQFTMNTQECSLNRFTPNRKTEIKVFLGSGRISVSLNSILELHRWPKTLGDFAEQVDFACEAGLLYSYLKAVHPALSARLSSLMLQAGSPCYTGGSLSLTCQI